MTATIDPLGWPEADCRTPAWVTWAILPRLEQLVLPGSAVLDAGAVPAAAHVIGEVMRAA